MTTIDVMQILDWAEERLPRILDTNGLILWGMLQVIASYEANGGVLTVEEAARYKDILKRGTLAVEEGTKR